MRYGKTEAGQAAFKARSPLLSNRQRSAFLLFDGRKTDQEVLAATAGLGVTPDDLAHLVEAGFLQALDEVRAAAPASAPVAATASTGATNLSADGPAEGGAAALSPAERYRRAYPIATRLTAGLGLRGFRLNVAVEAASGCEDLLELLPRIAEAVGADKARELERALRDD